MVKNSNEEIQNDHQIIEENSSISTIEENQIVDTSSNSNFQQKSSSNSNTKQISKISQVCRLKDSVKDFEKSAIGCVINYLRKHGPSPIESILDHVRSKELSLITSLNGKYKKNAFQITDYVLTWYPKIFKLNDRFHYYLNNEEADKKERKFHLKALTQMKKDRQRYKKKINQKREKEEKTKRIKEKIELDLNSETTDISVLTKAYLVLMSENEKEAEELKLIIRNAYLKLKNLI